MQSVLENKFNTLMKNLFELSRRGNEEVQFPDFFLLISCYCRICPAARKTRKIVDSPYEDKNKFSTASMIEAQCRPAGLQTHCNTRMRIITTGTVEIKTQFTAVNT